MVESNGSAVAKQTSGRARAVVTDEKEYKKGAPVPASTPEELDALRSGKRLDLLVSDPREETMSVLHVRIESKAPLLMHSFGAKARAEMLASQNKLSTDRAKKSPRDIQADLIDKLEYAGVPPPTWDAACKLKSGDKKAKTVLAVPAHWIKCAMVTCAVRMSKVYKSAAQDSFWIVSNTDLGSNMLALGYKNGLSINETVARTTGMGKKPYVNFRPCIEDWWIEFDIQFDAAEVRPAVLAQWLMRAGWAIGLGDFRPEKGPSGQYGLFRVTVAQAQLAQR